MSPKTPITRGVHDGYIYHEIRKISKEKAREVIRKILENNKGNVSKTALILGISRLTVRRGRDGPLMDFSRRPKHSPRKTKNELEDLIINEAKRTSFRYTRLASHLSRKYGFCFSKNTIRAILKRNKTERKKRRMKNGQVRHLYDYENLIPLSEFDTKHLWDFSALPEDVYRHMMRYNLPRYEWNLIDVATRARFTAYSYELSSAYGFMFIAFTMLWMRSYNVRNSIKIRLDNGVEFCSGIERKLSEWNEALKPLDVMLDPIPPRKTHLMGIVDNSYYQR